ncbi:DUF1906 domain-containing protein [uncultured Dietzia sp.]|uniref:DUF1906 domain-containing protein n=1 Tax=uncultured Dietzia sp. TaxID=395519 RepID=UPI0025EE9C9F|nr:DUF1906 domain-containing protein [uncultured Dietzia sp.]
MTFDRRTFLRRAGIGVAGAGALAAGITPAVGAQSSIPAGLGGLPGAGAGIPIGTILDYASGPPSAAAIRAAGHMGAVRYCSNRRPGAEWMSGKPLLRREVDDFRAHGLSMVSCYQYGRAETADWKGGAGGADTHAPVGIRIHREAGGPGGVPMYVAIDDNPTWWQFENQIAPYLERWRHHLGGAGMKLGVYANAPTIDWCRGRNLGEYFWQHDWGSNGRLNPHATIHQLPVKQQVTVGGVVSDLNRVYALDYGQWWPTDYLTLAQSALGSQS